MTYENQYSLKMLSLNCNEQLNYLNLTNKFTKILAGYSDIATISLKICSDRETNNYNEQITYLNVKSGRDGDQFLRIFVNDFTDFFDIKNMKIIKKVMRLDVFDDNCKTLSYTQLNDYNNVVIVDNNIVIFLSDEKLEQFKNRTLSNLQFLKTKEIIKLKFSKMF